MANPPEVEHLPEDAGHGPPPPKRKKTVTWAGDVPDTSAENEGPQSSAEDPAVIVVEQGAQDSLFAGLGDALLDLQEDVPAGSAAPLSNEALVQRRIDNMDKLYELYEAEMWSLYEELHLRHRQFMEQQQQQQQEAAAVPASEENGSGNGAQPAFMDQQPAADGGQDGQAGGAQPVDLRRLFVEHRRRQQAQGQQAQPSGVQAGVPSGGAAPGPAGTPGPSAQQQQAPGSCVAQLPAAQQGAADGAVAVPMEVVDLSQEPSPVAALQQAVAAAAVARQEGGPQGQPAVPQQGPAEGQPPAAAACAEPWPAGSRDGAGGSWEGEEADLPLFEEMEELIRGLSPGATAMPLEKLREQRAGFLWHLELIGRLEQSLLGTLCRELDAVDALAALCGRRQRYLLRKAAVLLGRSTESQGKVDVDLSGEGHSQTVSRQQAQLLLEPDGRFQLRCLGRRSVFVNGRQVEQGRAAALPHLSLIKVGGVSLLFVANLAAVQRVVRRSGVVAV